jgi:hypothetical protein
MIKLKGILVMEDGMGEFVFKVIVCQEEFNATLEQGMLEDLVYRWARFLISLKTYLK